MNEKLRRRVEEETARDQTRMRTWARRRQEKIERTRESPLLPSLCRILFICMPLAAIAAFTGDLSAHWRYPQAVSLASALKNAFLSALVVWSLFGAPFVACALLQMKKGFSDPWFERHSLTRGGKRRMAPQRKYPLQILAVLIIAALFGLGAYLMTRCAPCA